MIKQPKKGKSVENDEATKVAEGVCEGLGQMNMKGRGSRNEDQVPSDSSSSYTSSL